MINDNINCDSINMISVKIISRLIIELIKAKFLKKARPRRHVASRAIHDYDRVATFAICVNYRSLKRIVLRFYKYVFCHYLRRVKWRIIFSLRVR